MIELRHFMQGTGASMDLGMSRGPGTKSPRILRDSLSFWGTQKEVYNCAGPCVVQGSTVYV